MRLHARDPRRAEKRRGGGGVQDPFENGAQCQEPMKSDSRLLYNRDPMARNAGIRAGSARSLVLLGLLGLTAVSALAYRLFHEARAHRASAQTLLTDYAAMAARDYSNRFGMILDIGFLRPVANAARESVDRSEEAFEPELEGDLRIFDSLGRGWFRWSGGQLELRGVSEEADESSLMQAVRSYATSPDALGTYDATMSFVTCGERSYWLFGYRSESRGAPSADVHGAQLLGVIAEASDLARLFEQILEMETPIAPRLGEERSLDLVVSVLDERGHELFRSAARPDEAILQTAAMSERHGRMTVEVELDRASAGLLLGGGLPRSSGAEVLLLLGFALVPLLAAFRLLSKERELARLRSGFVASVSHELRTPLAQIRLFVETLRFGRTRSEAERQRSLEILERETRRLQGLVETVLLSSRAERDALHVHPEPTELRALVEDCVSAFELTVGAKGTRLEVEGEARLVAFVDPAATRVIVQNLVDNALKFGPAGQAVQIRLQACGEFAGIAVEDQGPGVDERFTERVFLRFWRDPGLDAQVTGSGIGLSLARELALLQGGRIELVNLPEGGARFTTYLPLGERGAA